MVGDLGRVGEGRGERIGDGGGGIGLDLGEDGVQFLGGGDVLGCQPLAEIGDRVAFGLPEGLLLLGPVVFAVDVADMVAEVAVGAQLDEERPLAGAGARDKAGGQRVDGQHVLSVDDVGLNPEGLGAGDEFTRGLFVGAGVFAVEVVLAGVDDGQFPERGHVHALVEQALAKRAVAEEADGDIPGAEPFGRHGCPGRDPGRTADDGVGAEVAVGLVGDVHRAALAPAVAFGAAEKFAEHLAELGALGDAMAVAAMGGGDLVGRAQRLADADGDGLLPGIHVGQAGHLGLEVELVGVILEGADAGHLAIHAQIVGGVGIGHRGVLVVQLGWGWSPRAPRPVAGAGENGRKLSNGWRWAALRPGRG